MVEESGSVCSKGLTLAIFSCKYGCEVFDKRENLQCNIRRPFCYTFVTTYLAVSPSNLLRQAKELEVVKA